MTTNGQAIVIDADAHVVECERTWEFMDPSERAVPADAVADREKAGVKQQFWLVDGKVRGLRFPAFSPEALEQRAKQAGRKFADMDAAREMGNVDMRLEHMDQTGVDVEVLHNTMFIEGVTERAAVDVALCKSWNRWLGDIWEHGKGRLLWSCMPPILSMPDALDQIRWSKQHGACAVLMRPIEGNRLLADPYFYPIYDEAQKLDIPIAVHIANGNTWLNDLYRHPVSQAAGLHRFRVPTVAAFSDVISATSINYFPNCAGDLSKPARSGCPGCCTKPRTVSKLWTGRGRKTSLGSTACLSPVKTPTTCRIWSRTAARNVWSSAPTMATWIRPAMSMPSRSSKSAPICQRK